MALKLRVALQLEGIWYYTAIAPTQRCYRMLISFPNPIPMQRFNVDREPWAQIKAKVVSDTMDNDSSGRYIMPHCCHPDPCIYKAAPPPLWEGLALQQINASVAIASLWLLLTANRWQ